MSDILFTHSYFLHHDAKEFRAMMPYPPLATLYAAAHIRRKGYTVALFDSMLAQDEFALEPLLRLHRPKVLVIYDDDFNYLSKMCLTRMREAAHTMTKMAKRAGSIVVVHGSDATDHPAEYLYAGADAVISGEGEQSLGEYLDKTFIGNEDQSRIPGLTYLLDGNVVRTSPRLAAKSLDALPHPARDLVDMEAYRTVWTRRHGYFSMNLVTTRGCPYHCNWCAKPVYGQSYGSRSPAAVAEELREAVATYAPDHIWFCDDIFGLKPGWIQEFADEIERLNTIVPFKCQARADLLVRGDTVAQLRRAGCVNVWVGAESGSQKILDAMEKGTTVSQIHEASRLLKQSGIRVGFFLQFGYPGETGDDIDLTLRMLRDCMPDDIGISISYPLPGTRFYENVQHDLGLKHNWTDSEDLALMFKGTFVPDYYRTLHKVTHKLLRTWQGAAVLSQFARNPRSLSTRGLRSLMAAGFHSLTLPPVMAKLRTLERAA